MVKIIPIICTRTTKEPAGFKELKAFFKDGVQVQEDQDSIFTGYEDGIVKATKNFDLSGEDILVFCHDDISIITNYPQFKFLLEYSLTKFKDVGFVGVAGTKKLDENCVWWNQHLWQQGYHRGSVYHGKDLLDSHFTLYTPPGKDMDREVIVLDGVFLACKVSMISRLKWIKPDTFKGNWDFYDLYTTWRARRLGYKNYVVPITIVHNSSGELVGRTGWEENRKEFRSLISTPVEIL